MLCSPRPVEFVITHVNTHSTVMRRSMPAMDLIAPNVSNSIRLPLCQFELCGRLNFETYSFTN